jgi:hypothetical protein
VPEEVDTKHFGFHELLFCFERELSNQSAAWLTDFWLEY